MKTKSKSQAMRNAFVRQKLEKYGQMNQECDAPMPDYIQELIDVEQHIPEYRKANLYEPYSKHMREQ